MNVYVIYIFSHARLKEAASVLPSIILLISWSEMQIFYDPPSASASVGLLGPRHMIVWIFTVQIFQSVSNNARADASKEKAIASNALSPSYETFWNLKMKQFPASLWFHWNESFPLVKIGIRIKLRQTAPNEFEVIGSHECQNWESLLHVQNASFSSKYEFKSWMIPTENQRSYSCYGLNVISIKNVTRIYGHIVYMQMWKKSE